MSKEETRNHIKIRELALLNQIGQEFSASLDLDSVIDTIMSRVKNVLECEASSVILYDKMKDSLVFYAASGAGSKSVKGLSIPMGRGIAGWVFTNRKAVVVDEAENDERFYPGIDKITGIKTKSLVCIPVEKNRRMIGVIEALNKMNDTFSEKDLDMLTAISQLAGISIENSIIHKNLEQKNTQLVQMNKELEEFVHIVSHDLQTPLASIEGYVGLIRSEMGRFLRENPDFSNYIERISENSQSMLQFIRRLLNYIKIKDNQISIDEFNPAGVVEEILVLLEKEIHEKNARILFPSNFKNIHYDRYIFHHILLNLLQNSLKYTAKGKQPVIEIGFHEEQNEIHFFIRDNGPGLSKEEQVRIFNLYEGRGKRELTDGFGIGLAFVKKAVELCGGTVWVENPQGRGTTFYFSVPG